MIVIAVGSAGYWFLIRGVQVEEIITPADSHSTTTGQTEVLQTSSSTPPQSTKSTKTYENKTWGIRFEYPKDWEITEPAFYSVVSKLNLSINPKEKQKYPETILINITPKEWIDGALKK